MVRNKKILLISPRFFEYEKAIVAHLEKLGAQVDFFDDRPSNTIFSKGMLRIAPILLSLKINRYYQKILKATQQKSYDYFLLIKGEACPIWFLKKLSHQHPQTQKLYYVYDSVAEYPKFLKLRPHFDRAFTFESLDAKTYAFDFLPLFYLDDYLKLSPKPEPQYDLTFIGTAHTDRFLVGEKVKNAVTSLGLKTFFYFYAPGKNTFRLKRIFDKHLQKFNLSHLKYKKLNHHEIASYYYFSKAVLDINKPFQFGVSNRTYEVLASGTKLITTNPEIANYPFYDPQNILIIDRENPKIPIEFFQSDFKKYSPEVLAKLSLDYWIQALFSSDKKDTTSKST